MPKMYGRVVYKNDNNPRVGVSQGSNMTTMEGRLFKLIPNLPCHFFFFPSRPPMKSYTDIRIEVDDLDLTAGVGLEPALSMVSDALPCFYVWARVRSIWPAG